MRGFVAGVNAKRFELRDFFDGIIDMQPNNSKRDVEPLRNQGLRSPVRKMQGADFQFPRRELCDPGQHRGPSIGAD